MRKLLFFILVIVACVANGQVYPVWEDGSEYSAGDVVTFQGITYQANQDITGNYIYTAPLYKQSFWDVIWEDYELWVAGLWYKQGMIVKYQGVAYSVTTNITNDDVAYSTPVDRPTYWLISNIDFSLWIPNASYIEGNIVTYESNAYRAKQVVENKSNSPISNCNEWEVINNEQGVILWQPGLAVEAGTRVIYNNEEYVALTDISCYVTGISNTAPDAVASADYWELSGNSITPCAWETSLTTGNLFTNCNSVGIGTNDPNFNLDVIGTSKVSEQLIIGPTSSSDYRLDVYDGSTPQGVTGNPNLIVARGLSGICVHGRTTYGVSILGEASTSTSSFSGKFLGGNFKVAKNEYTGTEADFIINTSGNVGIGTSTPLSNYKLTVNGTTHFSDKIKIGTEATSDYLLELDRGDNYNQGPADPPSNLLKTRNYDGNAIYSSTQNGIALYSIVESHNSGSYNGYSGQFINGRFIIARENSITDHPDFYVSANGSIGMGTSSVINRYKLTVRGGIATDLVTVKLASEWGWPDYVFDSEYELKELDEVKEFVQENKHLPDVPSAKDVAKDGINLGEMDAVLLRKIEEMTLYMIQQNERIEELEKELKKLQDNE